MPQAGGGSDPGGRHRGVAVAGGTGSQIYNNVFYNISGTETVATAQRLSSAIEVSYATNTLVAFNTIDRCEKGIKLDGVTGQNSTVRNNVVANSTITNYQNEAGGTIADHNLFDGTNPLFVNASAHDYHLQAASPALNVGIAVAGVTTDIEGAVRSSVPDLGAYEQP